MTQARLGFWMPLIVACTSCASAPVSYYTLIPSTATASAAPTDPCCVVDIRNVRIPSAVDRPELVVRRSDAEVIILSNDLWIAPLRDEIRSALLDDIRTELLQKGSAQGAGNRKFLIFVEISRFESEPARYALIEAEWRMQPAEIPKRAATVCTTIAQVEVGGGVPGVVQGYQQAISRVASSITMSVLAAKDGSDAICPSPQSL